MPTASGDELDALLAATLPGGSDVVHYTMGLGVSVTGRFTLNVGADLSSRAKYLTASAVLHFPR